MRALSIFSCAILFGTAVIAQEKAPSDCHKLTTDYIRLMCYDTVTGYVKPPASPSNPAQIEGSQAVTVAEAKPKGQQWRLETENSALHNRKDVWLSVSSSNTEGNVIGTPEPATLWLRCMENSTNLLIGFNRYTSDNQNVQFKLDDGPIQDQWMETMRGGEGIGIWSGSRAIPFIKGMFDKEALVLSYDTYEGPVEFTFNISGLREQIEPLASACGWSP